MTSGSASLTAMQAADTTITGMVIAKDGKRVQGAIITTNNYVMINGLRSLLERATGKTNSDGTYALSGLRSGQITASVAINNAVAMTRGEVAGDELYWVDGVELVVNFDLSTPAK